MAPLVLLILVLGVFPKPMLDVIEPTIVASMADIGVADPPPRVTARRAVVGTPMTPLEIAAPVIEYGLLAPVLVIFGAACVGVLVEALVPRASRRTVQLFVTVASILVALAATVLNWSTGEEGTAAVDSLALDGPTYFIWTILLVFGGVSFLLFAERKLDISPFAPSAAAVPGTPAEQEAIELKAEHTEVFPLALFALSGMMLFPASNDLITMFVALEILSLPLYLLCGLARRRRLLSQEAALKYFLLGALSSAFFLYGAALVYGYTGSFTLSEIDIALRNSQRARGFCWPGWGCWGSGCCSSSARCRSTPGPRTSTPERPPR